MGLKNNEKTIKRSSCLQKKSDKLYCCNKNYNEMYKYFKIRQPMGHSVKNDQLHEKFVPYYFNSKSRNLNSIKGKYELENCYFHTNVLPTWLSIIRWFCQLVGFVCSRLEPN